MRQRLGCRLAAGAVALALCVSLAACGGGGASGEPDEAAETTEQTSTTEPPATTTTVDQQAQALADAEAAYFAYEEAYLAAAADPVDPQHPELQALITDDQRIYLNGKLGSDLAAGEAVRPAEPSQFSSEVLSSTLQADGSVLLVVCRVDDRVVYKVATGEVVNDAVATSTVDTVMVNDSGAWKVSSTTAVARTPGVASCTG